jgi:hypothetical protein
MGGAEDDDRMMDIAAEELLARALAGDGDGVVAVLRTMEESERRAAAQAILSARDPWNPEPVKDALALAEFGVLPPSKIRRLTRLPVRWHASTDDPRFEDILRLRPRRWREQLLRRANWSLGLPWPAAYRLVRDGLADAPDTPWYYAASVRHVDEWRDDADWLAGPFWELFRREEAGIELSHGGWIVEPCLELADTGRVARLRLLSACLEALRRDFPPRATRFYRHLFEALHPDPDELHLVSGALLALLGAQDPLDVGLALSALTALQKNGKLDAQALLDALPPALTAPAKKHAVAAIALAGVVLRAEPALTGTTVEVLAEGLHHRRADVQRRAFRLIEPHLNLLGEDTLALLLTSAENLDPSIRMALGAHPAASTTTLPAPEDTTGARGESPAMPSQPLSHSGWERMPHSAGGGDIYRWYYGSDLEYGEALLARVRELPAPPGLREPLSTPTRRGGWIDAPEAARRLWHLTDPPAPWDLALMIMRLAPDTDHTARDALKHLDSPEAMLTRYALGEDSEPAPSHQALGPACAAAVAVRDVETYERNARRSAAAALELAKDERYNRSREAEPLPEDPLSALERYCLPAPRMLPWLATLWPGNHEPIFRMVIRWLWRRIPGSTVPELEPAVALIADTYTDAGPEAGLAAAICLSIDDVGLRTFAAETIINAITIGSSTGAWLGQGLSRALLEYRDVYAGLPDNKPAGAVPRRWADPLSEIARTSKQHAHAVHTALQILLASAPLSDRSRLTDILSLLRHLTLTHQWPVDNASARRFLSALSAHSQGGKIARDILSPPIQIAST